MKIALLHYHLNRGGVTRVIQNHLLALDAVLGPAQSLPVVLLYGGRSLDWPEDFPNRLRSVRLTLHPLPTLDYDFLQNPQTGTLDDQLPALLKTLRLHPRETIVHVHNHALGKNVSLPGSVRLLAELGYGMLLQLHDFAEDFRPTNFQRLAHAAGGAGSGPSWHGALYPQAAQVHYAVLSGRDVGILRHAGVDPGRLHLLPNPVPQLEEVPPRDVARRRLADELAVPPEARYVLYPVRCIRRKNLGEALLYGKLARPETVIGLTLPPLGEAEKPVYAAWKRLSAALSLPCRFETGAPGRLGFAENVSASDLILTTSVAEGFGMVFLESWLAGRPLAGRDLPEITPDFTRAGVALDGLRPRLEVPLDWLEVDEFRQRLLDGYRSTLAAFGRPAPRDLSDRPEAKIHDGLVDFADLDEPMQERVIRRVCCGDRERRRVLELNPWIEGALSAASDDVSELIRRNRSAIERHFSPLPSGRRLLESYQRVASSPRGGRVEPLEQPGRILDRFLDFGRFRLIRSQPGQVEEEEGLQPLSDVGWHPPVRGPSGESF
jgi:hypothetical protein